VDLSRKKYVVIAVLLITAFFLFSDKGVYFDQDLYKSNFMPPDLKQSESHINRIVGNDKNRAVYIASFGKSLEEALEQNETLNPEFQQIRIDGIAPQIVNISRIVPSLKTQIERLKRWNTFWTSERREQVREMILEAARPYKFKESSFGQFYDFIDSAHTQTVPIGENILYQQLARDYVVELDSGFAVISQVDVPKEGAARNKLQRIFAGSKALVMDKLHYAQEIITGLKQGFDQLVYISLGLVFLILLISFGRIELAIISFLPVSVSWLWIVGIMDLFGLQFNIFNVIILSFVFGLGIDYSIFYMRGLILDHKYGAHPQKTYRASIILSVITSVIGIGVLIFAKHPAMRSIAMMSVIGILTIILITFTLIPLAFRWLVSYSGGKRRKVVTALDTFTSILFFIGYVSGSLTMTLLIPFFMIFPAPRRKKRDVYRYFIKVFSAYIFLHPTIPIRIINEHKENFKKPAIIIANHQSVIDIMLMLLLSNKILIVTNERVWKHWLWGAVLRYAEYYPAFAEFDDMHRRIEEKIKQGYSIMIFPEGTRSQTGKIKRFHKGAFYMAQSLGVDILPILLHGVHECLRKGEFFLFTGKITMKILPRIDLQSGIMGTSMRDQAKAMTAFFRHEYEELRKDVADVDYYSVHLTRNFIYKGPVLEWYFRIKFRMEDRYRMFDKLIPRDAAIYDLGCGYGFLSLMLGLISPARQIRGIDFDEEKIKVAQNNDTDKREYTKI
jgi:1-acyl-sn-glycerol-3-phosphate acyltransferase